MIFAVVIDGLLSDLGGLQRLLAEAVACWCLVCLLAIVHFLHSPTNRREGINGICLLPAFICCITDNTWSQRHTTSSIYLVASQVGKYWLTLLTWAGSSSRN